MAKTPAAVDAFLKRLWDPALERAKGEVADMQAIIDREGGKFKLAPWDWWYYAEKVRQEKYALDDAALRPYFKLENVRQGIFTLCDKLYGLKFIERRDIPVYNPGSPGVRGARSRRPLRGRPVHGFPSATEQARRRLVGLVPARVLRKGQARGAALDHHLQFHAPHGRRALAAQRGRGEDLLPRIRAFAGDSALGRDVTAAGPCPGTGSSSLRRSWKTGCWSRSCSPSTPSTTRRAPSSRPSSSRSSRTSSLFNQGFETVEYLAASILDMAWHEMTQPQPGARTSTRSKPRPWPASA